MTVAISITNNWQFHVPLEARKIVGLKKGGKATLTVKDGELIIRPRDSKILSLGGTLNSLYKKRPVNIDKIREEIDLSSV